MIDGTFLFQVHFPNRLREEEYGVRSSLEKLLRMEKKHWSVSSCTPWEQVLCILSPKNFNSGTQTFISYSCDKSPFSLLYYLIRYYNDTVETIHPSHWAHLRNHDSYLSIMRKVRFWWIVHVPWKLLIPAHYTLWVNTSVPLSETWKVFATFLFGSHTLVSQMCFGGHLHTWS